MIAACVRYSLRQFIDWDATGIYEVGYWLNPPLCSLTTLHLEDGGSKGMGHILCIDPRYSLPLHSKVENLIGDPIAANQKIGGLPDGTEQELFAEMVANHLAKAKKHALLKDRGYNVNVSVE